MCVCVCVCVCVFVCMCTRRRDLAVLCIHSGDLQTARTELSAYMDTSAFANTADPFDKVRTYVRTYVRYGMITYVRTLWHDNVHAVQVPILQAVPVLPMFLVVSVRKQGTEVQRYVRSGTRRYRGVPCGSTAMRKAVQQYSKAVQGYLTV